jgi:hypothetical protein
MPISNHAKGVRNEFLAKQVLKSDGYLVEQKNWSRYAPKDFFSLFDILAIRLDEVRFIQIKSDKSSFYKARKDVANWVFLNNISPKIKCEVWLKENRTPWRIECVNELQN